MTEPASGQAFIYLFLEQKSISKGAVRRLGYKPPARAAPHVQLCVKHESQKGVYVIFVQLCVIFINQKGV